MSTSPARYAASRQCSRTTGSAAVRITDHLSRDLTIIQGKGSQIFTTWSADGSVVVSGRVASDGIRHLA